MAAKKRGRAAGFKMPDEHRTKIKNSCILKALIEHVEGTCKMSSTQVSAGLGLLKKCLPDLSNVTMSAQSEVGPPVVFINRYTYPEDDEKFGKSDPLKLIK